MKLALAAVAAALALACGPAAAAGGAVETIERAMLAIRDVHSDPPKRIEVPPAALSAIADPKRGWSFETNPGRPPTVVVLFDYDCLESKILAARLRKAMALHPEANVVLREMPILSPLADTAAKVGIAVARQDRAAYLRYHFSLMGRIGALHREAIMDAVLESGADPAALAAAVSAPETAGALEQNWQLFTDMEGKGTPIVVTAGEAMRGAPTEAELAAIFAGL